MQIWTLRDSDPQNSAATMSRTLNNGSLVNFTEATLLMKLQRKQISQWACGEASPAEHASHTNLLN